MDPYTGIEEKIYIGDTLEAGDISCPFCGCSEEFLEDKNINYLNKTVYLDMKCNKCGNEWIDEYNMIDESI